MLVIIRIIIICYFINNGSPLNVDIDECEQSLCGINEKCINDIGSFSCSCEDGFDLNESTICTGLLVKPCCII